MGSFFYQVITVVTQVTLEPAAEIRKKIRALYPEELEKREPGLPSFLAFPVNRGPVFVFPLSFVSRVA